MLNELKESWSAHQHMPKFRFAKECFHLERDLLMQHGLIQALRDRVERDVLVCIDRIPASAGWHAPAFVMRRAANLVPRVTLRDLARAAWEPEMLRQFNPFLSNAALMKMIHPAILEWLELCVLEDKLTRMTLIAAESNWQELERELREVGRQWSVTAHPEWL
eukprot:2439633-Prymnesium_polylepis.1